MSFNASVPTGLVKLNQDYLNVQHNFSASNSIFGVDHLPFDNGTAQDGYHTNIHLVPPSTIASNGPNNYPPNGYTTTGGYGQLFSPQVNDGNNSDEALYFLAGSGRLYQLTSNFVPTAAQNGATFLPGGLILNWGYVTPGAVGQTTVTLTQNLSKNLFNVQATMVRNINNVDVVYCVTTPEAGAFTQIVFRETSAQPFFWWAIGN